MNKTILLVLFLGLVAQTFADDCNNPLLKLFNITGLSEPTNVTGLKYCKSLQRTQSCCSADVVNTFQNRGVALGERLKKIVSGRDKFLVDTREKVLPGLQKSLKDLKSNSEKVIKAVKNNMQTLKEQAKNSIKGKGKGKGKGQGQGQGQDDQDQNSQNSSLTLDSTVQIVQTLQDLSKKVVDDLPSLKANFTGFQKSRTACIVQMIKLQAAAWCLSCDPAYASKGVSNDSIKLSPNLCNRLQYSCFDYLSQSATQSSILSIKALAPILDKLTISITNLTNSTNTTTNTTNSLTVDTLISSLEDSQGNSILDSAPVPSNDTQVPVGMPPNCTAAGQCPWICEFFFKNGQVNETIIAAGGSLIDTIITTVTDAVTNATNSSGRLLEEREIKEGSVVKNLMANGRSLAQVNQWEPDADEAGISVTFSDDPAGVSSTTNGSGLVGLGLVLSVLISMLLI